jgi:cytochrome c oxidase assembly protein subunit 15
MDAASGFDLTPVASVALVGLALAAGPLAWLWLRHRGAPAGTRLRALTLVTLFLCFDLVLFGAFTRLTDSGLGCPDWPGCYGSATPLGAHADIHVAQSALPSGPVTHGKAWIEMVHRYLASAVGLLIALLAFASWRAWRQQLLSARASAWAAAAFIWVCVQGAFGALTVTMQLYPAIVTAHLLGGVVLLAMLAVQAELLAPRPLRLAPGLRIGVAIVLLLTVVQVALGAWVSTNYAVLACTDFPTCQGSWWPAMDFDQGFVLRRHLGRGEEGWLPFAALTAIHVTHRLFAGVLLAAVLLLVWRLAAAAKRDNDRALLRWARALAAVAALQVATGLSNVVLGWPLVAALAHTAGAAVLVALLTVLGVRALQARRTVRATSSFGATARAAS